MVIATYMGQHTMHSCLDSLSATSLAPLTICLISTCGDVEVSSYLIDTIHFIALAESLKTPKIYEWQNHLMLLITPKKAKRFYSPAFQSVPMTWPDLACPYLLHASPSTLNLSDPNLSNDERSFIASLLLQKDMHVPIILKNQMT